MDPSTLAYSLAARDAIRAQMLAYGERHKIGVPKLRARMATATGRQPGEISLKTLQNFLADKRRTNDGFVKICDDFVNTIINSEQGPPLGPALGAFFLQAAGAMPRASVGEESGAGTVLSISALAPGTFKGMSPAARPAWEPGTATDALVPYATLTIEPSPHSWFVPVREEVFNWDRAAGRHFDESAPRHSYRGCAVMCGEILFVVARNILTGAARTYWLAGNEKHLYGRSVEVPFQPLSFEGILELEDVRVTYIRDEQG